MNNVIFTKFGDSDLSCYDIGDFWMQCDDPAKAEAEWKEAEKYRWHDLRKDPDDLPDEETNGYSYDVLTRTEYDDYAIAYINLSSKEWTLRGCVSPEDIVAWKYIEPFEKSVSTKESEE